ncbi:trypsin-like [Glandiceps talaboti]
MWIVLLLAAIAATAAQECGVSTIPPVAPSSNGIDIVGGVEAEPHSWPWTAQLKGSNDNHVCGASLIAPNWVITAAHCTAGPPAYRNGIVIHVGTHNRDIQDSLEQVMTVEEIFDHPQYNDFTLDNDIALIKLDKDVDQNDHVAIGCYAGRHYLDGTKCAVVGWGDTQDTGNELVLNQVDVDVIANDVCNQPGWYFNQVTENMVCAGYAAGGKDSCFGDSGGPLMCLNDDGGYDIFGLVSWGPQVCATENKPGVYTRVPNYYSWINTVIAENP